LSTDITDAARIDGCGELRILFSIVYPLSRPVLSLIAVFSFVSNWNAFLWPLVVVSKEEFRTLQTGLATLQSQQVTDYGLLMAGAAVSVVPMFIFFILLQRFFVRGVTVGALKG